LKDISFPEGPNAQWIQTFPLHSTNTTILYNFMP